LLPALYGGFMTPAGSSWRVAVLRPGNDPMGNLALALNAPDVLDAGDEDPGLRRTFIETTLRRSTLGLVDAVQQARLLPHENLLIVVDQFEELFRFQQLLTRETTDNEATAFVKLLLEATRQHEVPIYIVLTMRSDYLGDCAQFRDLPEAINDGQYLIPRLTREQLRFAITGPVAVGGATIALRLVHRLLNDVGDNPDQLPILQHALMRLWDYWEQHAAPTEPLDLPHCEAIGGMAEALSRHAEEAYEALPDDRARLLAQKLFQCLTEKGPDNREMRRPATLRDVCAVAGAAEADMLAIIEHFRRPGRSFLMPPADVKLTADAVLDISHESLMRLWQRLRMWVDEEAYSAQVYRRLAETAVLHEAGKAGLWRDPDLYLALQWRAQHRPTAAWAQRYHSGFAGAMAFLYKSERALVRQEAQQKQALQRTRLLVAYLSVALLVALVAIGVAYVQRQRAKGETLNAEKLRLREHTETVKRLLPIQPVEALGWTIRATGQSLAETGQVLSLAQASLMQAVRQARERHVFKTYAGPALSVAFSPDGQRIVSGSEEGRVRIWDVAGNRLGCGAHLEAVTTVAWSPDGKTIASGGADKVVRLWDVKGRSQGELHGSSDLITTIAISPDSRLLAIGSADASVTLWDLATRQHLHAFTGHTARVNAVAFSPDGTLLASVSDDATVKLWAVARHAEVATLTTHKAPVHTVAFSPDGKLLASGNGLVQEEAGSLGGLIKIWDATTYQEMAQFSDPDSPAVLALAFSPDSRSLLSSSGQTIRLWQVAEQSIRQTFVGHTNNVTSVAFSADGKTIASSSWDGTVRLWDPQPLPFAYALSFQGHPVSKGKGNTWTTTSADGLYLLSVDASNILRVWDSDGRRLTSPFQARGAKIEVAALNRSGQRIATGASDGTIQLWDLQGQLVGPPFTGHSQAVLSITFSPDDQHLVSGSQDGTIRVWDLHGQAIGEPFTGHTNAVWWVAFSPDGQRIVSGGEDQTVRLWDLQGHQLGQPFRGHTARVMVVTFSPDSQTIASGSANGTIVLWKLDGTLRRLLNADKSVVGALAFSPDGKRLVSGSADGMVRVWNLQGSITHQFQADNEVFTVRFSADGQRILIGGKDDMFHVWQWNVGWHAGLQAACERVRSHPRITQAEVEEAQEIRAICKQFASVTWPETSSQGAEDCP